MENENTLHRAQNERWCEVPGSVRGLLAGESSPTLFYFNSIPDSRFQFDLISSFAIRWPSRINNHSSNTIVDMIFRVFP